MDIILKISEELNLKKTQVESAIKLIDDGNTIPFIARYRKEATGGLLDSDLRVLNERLIYLRKLEERQNTVINSCLEQGKLTDELKESFLNAKTLSELEDLYRPFKPKKKTRASIAKEKGLEPIAQFLKEEKEEIKLEEYLLAFINEEKGVKTTLDALNGGKDIIAEEISDNPIYRKYIKDLIYKEGLIESKEIEKDEKDTYAQYASYSEKISSIPSHRILAINRGEKTKCLKISLSYDKEKIALRILKDYSKKGIFKEIFSQIIDDSLKRLVLPSVENEIRSDLFSKAEDDSIVIFKKNLASLLMYPPLKNKVILGFDPGFRTGCKYALVNENGIPQFVGVSFITSNKQDEVKKAKDEIKTFLLKNKIDYIALGNGTASRESEEILRNILDEIKSETKIFIVNESGASVYSASKLAEEEFPNLTVEKRSAISLARRVQDPLSELVKIDPKAIGVGQYQHDMDQSKLGDALNGVVEDCVNKVGVNLNNSSPSLLSYVSGIGKGIAKNIYDYLKVNGPFKTREDLKKVSKLGDKAFEQCAGFLRIYGGSEVLDQTSIHPESYNVAKYILKTFKIDLLNDSKEEKELKLFKFNKNDVLNKFKIGEETLNDIIEEILRPGRDIRDDMPVIELNNSVKSIEDLKEGMILNGTVRNIMDFGMFVDINVHQDGLVHISEVSNKYVKNISDLYSINDVIKVKVISLDLKRKRIGLSIKQVNNK